MSVGGGAEGGLRLLTRAGHELRTEAACLQLNLWMLELA